MSVSISNLSNYLSTLNFSDKFLMEELKLNIKNGLEYFKSVYFEKNSDLEDFEKLEDLKDLKDFELKLKLVLKNGYEIFFKINAILEFLHIIDESQTNKYKYEEANQYCLGLNNFINCIQDLFYDYEIDINKNIDLAKIGSNNMDLQNNYFNELYKLKNISTYKKINVFNNYINQYVFLLTKIHLIVKKISIC